MEEFARGFLNRHTAHRDTSAYLYANVFVEASKEDGSKSEIGERGEEEEKGARRERWLGARRFRDHREHRLRLFVRPVCVYLYIFIYIRTECEARVRAHSRMHVRADERTLCVST